MSGRGRLRAVARHGDSRAGRRQRDNRHDDRTRRRDVRRDGRARRPPGRWQQGATSGATARRGRTRAVARQGDSRAGRRQGDGLLAAVSQDEARRLRAAAS